LFQHNIAIRGQVKVPAGLSPVDSYRAECFGIYGGLYSLTRLINRLDISNDQVKDVTISIGCDNVSALQRCLDTELFPHVSGKDSEFDIISSVRFILPGLPILKWRHVKGHQTGPDLDIWARLNNVVDIMAGEARESSSLPVPPSDVP
jgi:hypothetical protein